MKINKQFKAILKDNSDSSLKAESDIGSQLSGSSRVKDKVDDDATGLTNYNNLMNIEDLGKELDKIDKEKELQN